jgi:hypothetical protein
VAKNEFIFAVFPFDMPILASAKKDNLEVTRRDPPIFPIIKISVEILLLI